MRKVNDRQYVAKMPNVRALPDLLDKGERGRRSPKPLVCAPAQSVSHARTRPHVCLRFLLAAHRWITWRCGSSARAT